MLVNIRCLWVCLNENVLHLKKRGLWNFSDMSSFVGEPAGMSPLHLCEPVPTPHNLTPRHNPCLDPSMESVVSITCKTTLEVGL